MWHADACSITYEGLWWNPPLGPVRLPPTDRPDFFSVRERAGRRVGTRPEFFVPHPWTARGRGRGRLRLRGLPHGQGPPAATTGPHIAACPILTEGLTIT
ncbi:hypothetical protein GCM10010313_33240 [Streptomyces violarus]|nr:hypothetical protein GCM10010313_33240 [Streptomyces violarus]